MNEPCIFNIWFNGIHNIRTHSNMVLPHLMIATVPLYQHSHLVIFDSIRFHSIRCDFAKQQNLFDKCEQERKSHFSHERFSLIIITVRTIVIITDIVANHANVLSYSQPTQNIPNRFYPEHYVCGWCFACMPPLAFAVCAFGRIAGATDSHYHNHKIANSVRFKAETFIFIACHSIVTVDCSFPASIL